MTSIVCGAVLMYLIYFVGAPWWLYIPLVPAMITDIAIAFYDAGKGSK